jgi:hypothetical protein
MVVRLWALGAGQPPFTPWKFPGTPVRGWTYPRAIVRLEGFRGQCWLPWFFCFCIIPCFHKWHASLGPFLMLISMLCSLLASKIVVTCSSKVSVDFKRPHGILLQKIELLSNSECSQSVNIVLAWAGPSSAFRLGGDVSVYVCACAVLFYPLKLYEQTADWNR